VEEIVGEILLDHVTAVSAANDKIFDSMRGISLHDVPKDWMSTDLHEGLRPLLSFLGKTSTRATGKDHGFHDSRSITGTVPDTYKVLMEAQTQAPRALYTLAKLSTPLSRLK